MADIKFYISMIWNNLLIIDNLREERQSTIRKWVRAFPFEASSGDRSVE